MTQPIILLTLYCSAVAAAIAFAYHWLMQDGHPLQSWREYIERELLKEHLPKSNPKALQRWAGTLLVGCSVCQSFWLGLAISLIFTTLPIAGCFVCGFFAMTITYRLYQ